MKKLSLDIGALRVESFDVSRDGGAARGTVRANSGFTTQTTFTETMVETTTDPNLNCMCHSGTPCVETLATACMPECTV
ncbi:MAG TPA: hypothetical protein VEX86_24990 [Longimicrobium sp.]|nr:hypothetical protein [Longimicrobium sp.]